MIRSSKTESSGIFTKNVFLIIFVGYNNDMTQISRDDVQYLAQLSSLELAADEADALQVDLEHIVAYITQLSELDTEGVEPTYQVIDIDTVMRSDTVDTYGVDGDVLVRLAPAVRENQIQVPKVL